MKENPYSTSNPYSAPVGPAEHYAGTKLKHSRLGIVSTVIAFLGGGTFLLATILAVVWIDEAQDETAVILGLSMIGSLFILFVGGTLGFIGVLLPDRKKLFPIIGILLNGMALLGIISLMVIGVLVQV